MREKSVADNIKVCRVSKIKAQSTHRVLLLYKEGVFPVHMPMPLYGVGHSFPYVLLNTLSSPIYAYT